MRRICTWPACVQLQHTGAVHDGLPNDHFDRLVFLVSGPCSVPSACGRIHAICCASSLNHCKCRESNSPCSSAFLLRFRGFRDRAIARSDQIETVSCNPATRSYLSRTSHGGKFPLRHQVENILTESAAPKPLHGVIKAKAKDPHQTMCTEAHTFTYPGCCKP